MKSFSLCLVLLLATLATLHNVACQEETVTTTLAPQVEEAKDKDVTTIAPPVAETTQQPADNSSTPAEEVKTEKPDTKAESEEKPKEEEKKEGDANEEKTPDSKDEEDEEKPKEVGSEQESAGPQEQPKIIFVQQHIRDPATGVVYTRQVPLIPSNYLRPVPYQPQGPPQPPQERPPQEQSSSYDPLGKFSATQKKRQFFQDMLVSQLAKFEREVEPMLEREENTTEKNDIEEILGSVGELKRTLEGHQIFNISELMNNWKQGKLGQGEGQMQPFESNINEQRPPMPQGPPPQNNFNRARNPPLTLRTLILVPQNRVMPQQQQPQPQYYQPFPMNRQIPVIQLQRRSPYQPIFEADPSQQGGHRQQQQPNEQLDAQPSGNEEYSSNNDIFGY